MGTFSEFSQLFFQGCWNNEEYWAKTINRYPKHFNKYQVLFKTAPPSAVASSRLITVAANTVAFQELRWSSPQLCCSSIWVTYRVTFCLAVKQIPCVFPHDDAINLFTQAIRWNIRVERHMVWTTCTSQSQFVTFGTGNLLYLIPLNWFAFVPDSDLQCINLKKLGLLSIHMYSIMVQLISRCNYSFTLILYTRWATFSTVYIQEAAAAWKSWHPCGQKLLIFQMWISHRFKSGHFFGFHSRGNWNFFTLYFQDPPCMTSLWQFYSCFFLRLELVMYL